MSLAELLLKINNEHNGHKSTVISGLTLQQGIDICKELEEYTGDKDSFVLELWTDSNFTIYKKDGLGIGKDQIIVSTC
ncbi:hypothetical protein [Pseudomonas phage vB_PsaM_M1]|nr:hypothetical protein [Pseudomonas phage vB_PsaM_M1]